MSDGILFGGVFAVGLAIGVFVGCLIGDDARKTQAVQVGHAEYYLDKDNNRQWRWKETK